MRVLVVGGGEPPESLIIELRRRGDYKFAVLGASDDAVSRLGVETIGRPTELDGRVEVILGAARGRSGELAWGDPAWALIEAIAECDAVVIGGDPDRSSWSALRSERLLVSRLADAFNKSVVLSGQTIWPPLTGGDRAALAELLSGASLVGLSDRESFDIASRELAVSPDSLRRTLDVELFTEGGHPMGERPPSGWCVLADLDGLDVFESGGAAEAFAAFLDAAAEMTGSDLVIVDSGDVGGVIIGAIKAPFRLLDEASEIHDDALLRAAVVITGDPSRCRSALKASVPFLAISTDLATDRQLVQLAGDFGLAEAVLPVASVVSGDAVEVLRTMVSDGTGRADADLIEQRRAEAAAWWDEVHAALQGSTATRSTLTDAATVELLSEPVRRRTIAFRDLQRALVRRADQVVATDRSRSEELVAALASSAAIEAHVADIAAERDGVLAELAEAELALVAAHAASIELVRRFERGRSAAQRRGAGRNWGRATAKVRDGWRTAVRRAQRAVSRSKDIVGG